MLRYKLRTLLIVLALGPPVLAFAIPPLLSWLNRPQAQPRVDLKYHGELPERLLNGMAMPPPDENRSPLPRR